MTEAITTFIKLGKALWGFLVGMILGGAGIMTWVYTVETTDAALIAKNSEQDTLIAMGRKDIEDLKLKQVQDMATINSKLDTILIFMPKKADK